MKFTYKAEELKETNPVPNATRRDQAEGDSQPHKHRSVGWLLFEFGLLVLLAIVGTRFARSTVNRLTDRTRASEVSDKPSARVVDVSASVQPAGQNDSRNPSVTEKDVAVLATYLEMQQAEFDHLCEYVRTSPFLGDNAQYAKIARELHFYMQTTNHEVNAYATVTETGERQIVCFAGETRFAKTVGLAVAAVQFGDKGALQRFTKNLRFDRERNDFGNYTIERAVQLICDGNFLPVVLDEKKRRRAQSIAAGAVISTLAHEAGHQVLGHLSTKGLSRLSDEVSRNQEREADSVASSIMSRSELGEYEFIGRLISHWIKWKKQEALGLTDRHATTHPASRERFENLVRANRDRAAEYGFAVD